ncbi:ribokinase [Ligilactobacillus acidipiscis]|uniref:ribokinase n=1 Tax=Ligilactobacillus acidipiscis TaxID=89059 RepID=UPI0022E64FA7|nr:ribokinase [Ligilactobacillus acidipiscis]
MKKILVIGSFMTDLVIKSKRFTKTGETIFGESFDQFTGGKGANQAVAAARLGGNVEMIGELGKDSFGEDQIASLKENNVKHDNVLFTNEAKSGVGNPQIDSKGQNRIVVVPGANLMLKPEDLKKLEGVIKNSDIIVLQLEIPLETVYKAIEIADKYNKTIILNPAPAADLDDKYASLITYIAPNESEAEYLTGISTDTESGVKKAADALLKKGYQNVVITLGEKGSYFKNENSEYFVPAYEVKSVDSTAAGDEFIGSLAYGIANNWAIRTALEFSSAASALSVTKMGAQPSLPVKKEVDNFIPQNKLVQN